MTGTAEGNRRSLIKTVSFGQRLATEEQSDTESNDLIVKETINNPNDDFDECLFRPDLQCQME